jgi:hypothetical protein
LGRERYESGVPHEVGKAPGSTDGAHGGRPHDGADEAHGDQWRRMEGEEGKETEQNLGLAARGGWSGDAGEG